MRVNSLHSSRTFPGLCQTTVIVFHTSRKRTTHTIHCPRVNSKWAVTKLIFSFLATRLSCVDSQSETPAELQQGARKNEFV